MAYQPPNCRASVCGLRCVWHRKIAARDRRHWRSCSRLPRQEMDCLGPGAFQSRYGSPATCIVVVGRFRKLNLPSSATLWRPRPRYLDETLKPFVNLLKSRHELLPALRGYGLIRLRETFYVQGLSNAAVRVRDATKRNRGIVRSGRSRADKARAGQRRKPVNS